MPTFYRFNKETKEEQQCEFNESHKKQLAIIMSNKFIPNIESRLQQLELINTWNRQGLHSQWEYYL